MVKSEERRFILPHKPKQMIPLFLTNACLVITSLIEDLRE